MAEDSQYSSGDHFASAKRKYDDTTAAPPPSSGRRPTGFSAPILPSQSPDSTSAYNTVPPPADEIELAKQKAQEIAARLFNNSESKRLKFDNGGGGYEGGESKGFGSGPTDYEQKLYSAASSVPSAYSYGGSSKKIEIPNGRVGVIIGKGGETIKYFQLQSGAKIQITRDMEADPHSLTRSVEITGQADAIAKAEQLIKDVLAEAESGGSGIVSRWLPGQQGGEQFVMKVANNKVGLIIGKGGETIKSMQASSGARIQVIPLHLPPGDTSTERNVQINGTPDQIEAAKQLVNEVISENRLRNPMGSGGYSQQGYQAQPQTNWAQPGPQMQQPGYGYMQSGGYGQPGQYTQPPYGGYPQQTPGGYATGWDQSKTGGAGGYEYYNQQQGSQTQPPGGGSSAPTDGSAYGYGQQGQTYGQDGYGGYGAGYGQPGYGNPTSGYNATSESTEGAAPPTSQAGYGTASPTSQAGYGAAPPTSQAGYGAAPPTSQAGYGVAPPTSQAGYGAAPRSQAGYGAAPPTSQAGYGSQPPSGYAGYGPPPTQKPPVTPTYGQQPQQSPQGGYAQPAPYAGGPPAYGGGYSQAPYGQQPAAYGSAYGGGYSQQPPTAAYPGDAAAPAPQATPPSGGAVAKASP